MRCYLVEGLLFIEQVTEVFLVGCFLHMAHA